jgi:hypothetical protein
MTHLLFFTDIMFNHLINLYLYTVHISGIIIVLFFVSFADIHRHCSCPRRMCIFLSLIRIWMRRTVTNEPPVSGSSS